MTRIGSVWAEAGGGAIGRDGEIPWSVPEDMAHFKEITMGAPVIMGRLTWESLPERFRPLPGRENIVVSRNPDYQAEGATVVTSLAEVAGGSAHPQLWVIGGGQLYREAMPIADELYVTRIDTEVPGADAFAPEIDSQWQLLDTDGPHVSRTGLSYRFERWGRRSEDAVA